MSAFNKQQEFKDKAKDLERQFLETFGDSGNPPEPKAEETTTPTPEATSENTAPPESTPETTPENTQVPETQPSFDEEEYKKKVKAMNAAQKAAAEAEKRKAEAEKLLTEIAEKREREEKRIQELLDKAKTQASFEPEDDLETDMPEVTKIAKKYADKARQEAESRLKEIEARYEAERKTREEETQRVIAERTVEEVLAAHPDYPELVNSEEMINWVNNEAPPIYKSLFDGGIPGTAKDFIAVLNHYKSAKAPQSKTAKPSTAEMVAPVKTTPQVSTKIQTEKPITDADLIDYQNNVHRWSPEKKAEFNTRLEAWFKQNQT